MAGCAPACHGTQRHLSCSAAACTGTHAGSQSLLAAGALPGAAGAHDTAPALEPPLSLSPSRLSSSLLGYIPASVVSIPHLEREGPSRAGSVPSHPCRAGVCPIAVVLLHLGARSKDWSRGSALSPLPCKGTASSHVNC